MPGWTPFIMIIHSKVNGGIHPEETLTFLDAAYFVMPETVTGDRPAKRTMTLMKADCGLCVQPCPADRIALAQGG